MLLLCGRSPACNLNLCMHTALTFSWWSPLLFLFPFTAPIVRPLAAKLPDVGFRRILGARKTIRDVALRLIAKHRRFLEQVLSCLLDCVICMG